MIVDILVSEDFVRMLDSLSLSMRDIVRRKIRLLAENPRHPSLNVHPLHQVKERDIWDCYISDSMRLLYEIEEGKLHLWDLGSHAIVDKVCIGSKKLDRTLRKRSQSIGS
jgi:addiction module RelE/StbE family toxin